MNQKNDRNYMLFDPWFTSVHICYLYCLLTDVTDGLSIVSPPLKQKKHLKKKKKLQKKKKIAVKETEQDEKPVAYLKPEVSGMERKRSNSGSSELFVDVDIEAGEESIHTDALVDLNFYDYDQMELSIFEDYDSETEDSASIDCDVSLSNVSADDGINVFPPNEDSQEVVQDVVLPKKDQSNVIQKEEESEVTTATFACNEESVCFTIGSDQSIIEHPHSHAIENMDSEVVLKCKTSKPISDAKWFCNGMILSNNEQISIKIVDRETILTLSKFLPQNKGRYHVLIDGSIGSQPATISGPSPPVILNKLTKPITHQAGKSFTYNFTFHGAPAPRLRMLHKGEPVSFDVKYDVYDNVASLYIPKMTKKDGSDYIVVLENKYGKDESEINISMVDTPLKPRKAQLVHLTDTSANIQWLPPHSGESDILHYIIQRRSTESRRWRNLGHVQEKIFTAVELVPNEFYAFRIVAVNSFGEGAPSDIVEVNTLDYDMEESFEFVGEETPVPLVDDEASQVSIDVLSTEADMTLNVEEEIEISQVIEISTGQAEEAVNTKTKKPKKKLAKKATEDETSEDTLELTLEVGSTETNDSASIKMEITSSEMSAEVKSKKEADEKNVAEEKDAEVTAKKKAAEDKSKKDSEAKTKEAADEKKAAEDKSKEDTEVKAKKEADEKKAAEDNVKKDDEVKVKKEADEKKAAEEKSKKDAEVKVKKEADEKKAAEEKSKEDTEVKAKKEADEKKAAEDNVKKDSEAKTKEAADEKKAAEDKSKKAAKDKSKKDAEVKAKKEADEKKAAEDKAKKVDEVKVKKEADEKKAAEEKSKKDAEVKAKKEANEKKAAEDNVKKDSEAKTKEAADEKKAAEDKSKKAAKDKSKKDAEVKAKKEADEKKAAEDKAKKDDEVKVKKEADEKKAAEEKSKKDAEVKAKKEADEKKAAEDNVKKDSEAKTKEAADEKKAAEDKSKKAAKDKSKKDAEVKAKKEADEKKAAEDKAKKDDEVKVKKEADEKKAAEEKSKEDAEVKAKKEADEKKAAEDNVKKDSEAKTKEAADEKKAAEDKSKKAAKDKSKKDAEVKAKKEADDKKAAEEKAKKDADVKAKKEADDKKAADDKAKKDAEAKVNKEADEKKAAEDKSKKDAEVKAKKETDEKKAAEDKSKKDSEAKSKGAADEKKAADEHAEKDAEAKTKKETDEKKSADEKADMDVEAKSKKEAEDKKTSKTKTKKDAKIKAEKDTKDQKAAKDTNKKDNSEIATEENTSDESRKDLDSDISLSLDTITESDDLSTSSTIKLTKESDESGIDSRMGQTSDSEDTPFTSQPSSLTVTETTGEARFEVKFSRKPIYVKWMRDNREIRVAYGKVSVETTEETSILVIKNVDGKDVGNIYAVFDNEYNSAIARLELRVPCKITLDSINTPTEIVAGKNLDISVKIDGFPAVSHIELLHNNENLQTRADVSDFDDAISIRMKRVKIEDSGEIKIFVKNDVSEDVLLIPVKVIDVPSKPSSLQVTSRESEKVILQWMPPNDVNGSEIIEYIVERKTTDSKRWRHACTVTKTAATVDGLFSSTEYVFRVIAVNSAGQSSACESVEAETLADEDMDGSPEDVVLLDDGGVGKKPEKPEDPNARKKKEEEKESRKEQEKGKDNAGAGSSKGCDDNVKESEENAELNSSFTNPEQHGKTEKQVLRGARKSLTRSLNIKESDIDADVIEYDFEEHTEEKEDVEEVPNDPTVSKLSSTFAFDKIDEEASQSFLEHVKSEEKDSMALQKLNKKIKKKDQEEDASTKKKSSDKAKSDMSIQQLNKSMKKQGENKNFEKSEKLAEADETQLTIQELNKKMKNKKKSGENEAFKTIGVNSQDSTKLALHHVNADLSNPKADNSTEVIGGGAETEKADDSLSLQSLNKTMKQKKATDNAAEIKLVEKLETVENFTLQDLYEELTAETARESKTAKNLGDDRTEKTAMEIKHVEKNLKKKKQKNQQKELVVGEPITENTSLEVREFNKELDNSQKISEQSSTFNFGQKDQEEYSMEVNNLQKKLTRQDAEEIQSGKLLDSNDEKTELAIIGKNKKLKKKPEEVESAEYDGKATVSTADSFAETTLRTKKLKNVEESGNSESNINQTTLEETAFATTRLDGKFVKDDEENKDKAEHQVPLKNQEKTSLATRKKKVSFDASTKSESVEDIIPAKNKEDDRMHITEMKMIVEKEAEAGETKIERKEKVLAKEKTSLEEKTVKLKSKSKKNSNESTEKKLGSSKKENLKDSLSLTGQKVKSNKEKSTAHAEKMLQVPSSLKRTETKFSEQSFTAELDKFIENEDQAEKVFAEPFITQDQLIVTEKVQRLKRDEESEQADVNSQSSEKDSLACIGTSTSLEKKSEEQAVKENLEESVKKTSYAEKTKDIKKNKTGQQDDSAETSVAEKPKSAALLNLGNNTEYISKDVEQLKPENEESADTTHGKANVQGNEYAEITKGRKFKRAEQLGETETIIGDSTQTPKRSDSLAVSDTHPEIRRSSVEISAFGQIDLVNKDATSLTDTRYDTHLEKEELNKTATKDFMDKGSKKKKDSMSISSQDNAFKKGFETGEASATVAQEDEERAEYDSGRRCESGKQLSDAHIEKDLKNDNTTVEMSLQAEEPSPGSEQKRYSEKKIIPEARTAASEKQSGKKDKLVDKLSTAESSSKQKQSKKGNKNDDATNTGMTLKEGQSAEATSDATEAGLDRKTGINETTQDSSEYQNKTSTTLDFSIDSQDRTKQNKPEHVLDSENKKTEDSISNSKDGSIEERAQTEKQSDKDKHAESRRKGKKPNTTSEIAKNLNAASLSGADSEVFIEKASKDESVKKDEVLENIDRKAENIEELYVSPSTGADDAKTRKTVKKTSKNSEKAIALVSSFEKPEEKLEKSKTIETRAEKDKSSFAENSSNFDLESAENQLAAAVSNAQCLQQDSDSLALQDAHIVFNKSSDSRADTETNVPQRELTLKICQAETIDWSDCSDDEVGETSTSDRGVVKKKKKFIISAISQDGEFSDAESITFDENGVRVEKRRRRKKDPNNFLDSTQLAMKIPAFAKKMQYIGCIEEDMVKFTIKVIADEVPLIRMYRNDFPVNNFDKMVFEGFTKGNEHTFNVTIKTIRKMDGGKLVFEAKNDFGMDKCTILLDVRDSGSFMDDFVETHRSAGILEPISDVLVKEGDTATLSGKVEGYPLPELVWIKNGKEIDMMVPSTKYQLEYHSDGEFEARIANCTFEDDDDYSLLVENLAGVDSCNFQVVVDCKSYPNDEHFNRRRRLQRGRRIMGASSDSEFDKAQKKKKRRTKRVVERKNPNAPRLTQLIPPRFDKILSDHDALEGDNIVMMVQTLGEPEPQVRFYRDGKLIDDVSGERLEIRHEEEMRKHWLILKDICKDEEAEYACQAINVAGEAWCFSDVVVHMSQESHDEEKLIGKDAAEKDDTLTEESTPKPKRKVVKKKEIEQAEQKEQAQELETGIEQDIKERSLKDAEAEIEKTSDENKKKDSETKAKKKTVEKQAIIDNVIETTEAKVNKEANDKAKKDADAETKKESTDDKVKKDVEISTKKEADDQKAVDDKTKKETEVKAKKAADDKTKKDAESKTKKEADDKNMADDKAKKEAEAKAKKEVDDKKTVDDKAKKETEAKVKKEADEKKAADDKAKKDSEAKTKKETEDKKAVDDKAKKESEAKAKKETDDKKASNEKAKKDAEAKTKKEADEKKAADDKAKKDDEAKKILKLRPRRKLKIKGQTDDKKASNDKAKKDAEAKTKKEADDKKAADDKAKKDSDDKKASDDKAKKDAEAKTKKEADEKKAADDKAKKDSDNKKVSDDKAKKDAEAKTKKESDEKKAADDKAKKDAEAKTKKEADDKKAADDKAKKDAEAKTKKESDEKKAADDKAKKDAEAKTKKEADDKKTADDMAKKDAEAKAKKEAEDKKATDEKDNEIKSGDGKPPKPEDLSGEATSKKRIIKKKKEKSDSVASDASLADVSKISDVSEDKPKKKVLRKKTEKSDSVISETSSVEASEAIESIAEKTSVTTDSAVESEATDFTATQKKPSEKIEESPDEFASATIERKSSSIFSDGEESITSKTSSEGRRRRRRTGFASVFASETLALRGDNVEIEVELLNEDDQVTWQVNGKDASSNQRYHEMSHTFFRTLIIDEVQPEDSGMKITARCEDETHTTVLKVEELPTDFVKFLPRKSSGKEGQEITISVTLNHPIDVSKVIWLKDGKQLDLSKEYSIDTVGCSVSLTLRRAKYEDSGKYTVVCDGVECNTQLSVQGKPVLKNQSEKIPVIQVDKDEQFSIHVAYDSNPEASFSMSVDGKELEFDGRSRIDVVDDGLKLTRRGVSKADSGEYEVKLKNEFGEVSQKFDVKVNDAPSAPADISVVKTESNCLHIEWNAPTENNGAEITSYVIEKKENGRRKFHKVASVNGRKDSFVVDDLEMETAYIVRVAAVNKFGVGEFVETKPVQTGSPFQLPTVEFPPTISAVSSTSCSLAWPKPINDGGSPVYGYDVYKREDGGEWKKLNGEDLVFTENFNVRALSSGKEYEFKIEACNEAGLRSNSNVVSEKLKVEGFVPETILDSPVVIVLDNDKVEVSWQPEGEKQFVVQYKSDGSSIWANIDIGAPASESDGAVTKCIIDGLREGISYVFRVAARNEHGTGEFSDPTNPIVVLADDAPRILKAIRSAKIPKRCELRLECHAAGHPAPEYIWYKDGKEIIPMDENTEIVNEGSMSALIIHEMSSDDVGTYKVLVENVHGIAESEAEVSISDVRAHFNSSFSELTEIEEGHEIELTCEVSDEEAVVNWYKDGKKLVASDRVQFYAMARKRTLRIKGSTDADSGVYKLLYRTSALAVQQS
uniref:Fibronectin type-III domain-containing protein n=1 Tax=Caenorhabditis japonica TaxID=281687 RepID=A0A8R1HRW0_CAEJA